LFPDPHPVFGDLLFPDSSTNCCPAANIPLGDENRGRQQTDVRLQWKFMRPSSFTFPASQAVGATQVPLDLAHRARLSASLDKRTSPTGRAD